MLEDAIEKYNIDREKSYMIGDKASDIGAGLKSKLKNCSCKDWLWLERYGKDR